MKLEGDAFTTSKSDIWWVAYCQDQPLCDISITSFRTYEDARDFAKRTADLGVMYYVAKVQPVALFRPLGGSL